MGYGHGLGLQDSWMDDVKTKTVAKKVDIADAIERATFAGEVEHQVSRHEALALYAFAENMRTKVETRYVETTMDCDDYTLIYEGPAAALYDGNFDRQVNPGRATIRVMVKE